MYPQNPSGYDAPILTIDEVAEFSPPEVGSFARFEAAMVKQTLPTGATVYRGVNGNMVGTWTPRRDDGLFYGMPEWRVAQEHFSGAELDRAAMMLSGLMRNVGESDAEYRARVTGRIKLSAVAPSKRGCPECPAGLGEKCADDCPRVLRYKATRCCAKPQKGQKLAGNHDDMMLATGDEWCGHDKSCDGRHVFRDDFCQWRWTWDQEPEFVTCSVCTARIIETGPMGLTGFCPPGSGRCGPVCDGCKHLDPYDLEWHGDRLVPKTKPGAVWTYELIVGTRPTPSVEPIPLADLCRALRAALPTIAPTWDACDRKPLQAAAHEVCEIGEAAGDVGGVPLQPMLVGMLGIIAAAPHLAPKVATEQANKVLGEMRRAFPRKRT